MAIFNDVSISASEFIERYNFSPQVDDKSFAADSGKSQFLASLIAEKLWAKEAELLGMDQDENYRGYITILKKILIRDELFNAVIESKVNLTDADLQRAEEFSKITLSAINISNPDSVYILSVYNLLTRGEIDFDSAFLAQPPPANKNMLILRYGNLVDEKIEEAVFRTKAGSYTKPLKDGGMWHIFKVLRIETGKSEPKDPIESYKNKLKERRLKGYGEAYLDNLLKDVRVDISNEGAGYLTKIFGDRIGSKFPSAAKDSILLLNESDFSDFIKSAGKEKLQLPVILTADAPLRLIDVFHYFSFNGFSIKAEELNNLNKKIVRELHKITQDELLYREGIKSVLFAEKSAEQQLAAWRGNALAQMIRNRYLDSVNVTEKEALEFYQRMNSSREAEGKINVAVIYHGNLDSVSALLDRLSGGEEFSVLASGYPQKKIKTGTLLPYSEYSPFETTLENAKIGDVVGPLKKDNGYYLFKILNKKDADSVFLKPFAIVKKDIELILKSKRSERALNQKTERLAIKYSVKINDDVLAKIAGRKIPMVMYRFTGFGGRITAAPFVSPMYEWIKDYRKRESETP